MVDSTPIFTEDDDIEREIVENEKRDVRPEEPVIEQALDTIISPVTNAIAREELTPEEAEAVRRETNRDQLPE